MTEALEVLRPPVQAASTRQSKHQCCSFCRAQLDDASVVITAASRAHNRRSVASTFCSTYCRDCVLALAALHPSPLASSDFVSTRTLLTDRLLDLWRNGGGPDPALVLAAALNASCGLAADAAPQQSTR